ncbi:MAG: hypothetical protein LQ352_006421, partial [Teloschistes flavicans]
MANMMDTRNFFDFLHFQCKKDRQFKPVIRHQNPRMNAKGIKPAPPLPPRLLLPAPGSDTFTAPRPVPEPGQLKKIERKQAGMAKKREKDEKSPSSRIPEPTRGRVNPATRKDHQTDVDCEAKRPRADVESLVNAGTKKVKTIAARITDKDGGSGAKELNHLLPRLPYQRMRLVRRIGAGGEGYCDLFKLHYAPRSQIVVKTLLHAPNLVVRKSGERKAGQPHKNYERKPREAYILQEVLRPHPRILRLHDYTSDSLLTKLYYEYCPLNTLTEVIVNYRNHNARIPEAFIWHALSQLAEAVAYIHLGRSSDPASPSIALNDHFRPILHRDIKPENVFLRPSTSGSIYPDVVLADFGLATHNASTDTDRVVGTPSFQPPEIPLHTPASDIWSVGATVHALIHGREPMVWPIPRHMTEAEWMWDPSCR